MSHYSIQLLPAEERPRERLRKHGYESMSTVELLAIILGSGTKGVSVLDLSHKIMNQFQTPQKLAEASIEELSQIKGLGPAKALQIKAALGLGIRLSKNQSGPKFRIDTPHHVYNLVKDELQNEKRELFLVLLIDAKGCAMDRHIIAIGTLTEIIIHPREVFYPAIRHKAASLVLIHNHPSGDTTPSSEDIETTKALIEAGSIINIPVNDHIIIGENNFLSLRQTTNLF